MKAKRKAMPVNIPKKFLISWIKLYVPLSEMLKVPGMQQELIRRGMATKRQIAAAQETDLQVRKLVFLTARATEVLGDPERAKTWIRRPLRVLGGKAPIECSLTASLLVLGRLEYGVFA
jgi:putative toxin-antitoxin system antitoxin component (TIGR02293 family)